MEQKFLQFIYAQKLVTEDQNVLVAVSGGVDSMVLAHLFCQTKIPIGVAHINHQLRGTESDDDEAMVKKFCQNVGIPFYSENITPGLLSAGNLQEEARQIRYQILSSIADTNGYSLIATAHHMDDNLETTFINLMRGSGLDGLTGIPVKNNRIIRPLLFATRTEILKYAEEKNITFREDSSNQSNKYTRNTIRNTILPQFDKIDYRNRKGFYQSIQNLKSIQELLHEFIHRTKLEVLSQNEQNYILDIQKIKQYQNPVTLLFYLIKDFGFHANQVEDMFKNHRPGAKFESPSHTLQIEKDNWVIHPITVENVQPFIWKIDVMPGNKGVKSGDWEICKLLKLPENVSRGIDISKITFPIYLRPWKNSDVFYPLSMKGKKKDIKKVLSELKIPILSRKNQWVIVDDNQEIIALLPHQISYNFVSEDSKDGYLGLFLNDVDVLYYSEIRL